MLVGVLIVQVWRGVKESSVESSSVRPVDPRGANVPFDQLDEATKDRIRGKFPDVTPVPAAPEPLPSVPASKLVADNPFCIWRLSDIPENEDEEKPDIEIKYIRSGKGGVPTAKLVIDGKSMRLEEGEEKNGFRIEEIDEEAETVKVFSESHGKAFTITKR